MKKSKIIRQFIILVAICIVTFIVNLLNATVISDGTIHHQISMEKGWETSINGESVGTVNVATERFPMMNKNDDIVLKNILPENLVKHPVLRVYSVHSVVYVWVDDVLRYKYGEEEERSNKLIGYGYHYIPLDYEDGGKEIVLEYRVHENTSFSSIETPIIADGDYVARDFMVQNKYRVSIILFLIMFGIVVVVVAFIYTLKKKNLISLVMVGAFSISIGWWSLCTTNIIGLFTYSLYLKTFMEFGSLYLAPSFLFAYFWGEIRKEGGIRWIIYNVLLWLQVTFSVVAWVCQLTGIIRFPAFLTYCHMLLGAILVFLLVRFFSDLFRGEMHSSVLVYGFEFLSIFIIFDLLRFNIYKFIPQISNERYVSLVYVGVLIFVITMLIDFCTKYIRSITEQIETQTLEKLAYTDHLTGLANRRALEDKLDEIEKAEKLSNYVVIGYDLNYLKKVNDQLGHEEGDRYIKEFANALDSVFKDCGITARSGGDEFVTVIPDVSSVDVKKRLLQLEDVINEINKQNEGWTMSPAYGYCFATEEEATDIRCAEIVADERMYKMKREMKAERK